MSFIWNNSGKLNAWTAMDYTQYFFEIRNSAFAEAIKIFSGFFHSPLFDEKSLKMELQNVNSEFLKNISNDSWRDLSIFRLNSNPASAFNKFSTGNNDTLDKPGLYKRIKDFYNNNYR